MNMIWHNNGVNDLDIWVRIINRLQTLSGILSKRIEDYFAVADFSEYMLFLFGTNRDEIHTICMVIVIRQTDVFSSWQHNVTSYVFVLV